MSNLSDDFMATPEGLAARFNYPNVIPPVRVLDAKFVDGSRDIVHLVQLAPDGVPRPPRWMDIRDWRELVGMPSCD